MARGTREHARSARGNAHGEETPREYLATVPMACTLILGAGTRRLLRRADLRSAARSAPPMAPLWGAIGVFWRRCGPAPFWGSGSSVPGTNGQLGRRPLPRHGPARDDRSVTTACPTRPGRPPAVTYQFFAFVVAYRKSQLPSGPLPLRRGKTNKVGTAVKARPGAESAETPDGSAGKPARARSNHAQ